MIPRFPPVLALTNEGSKACKPNMVSAKRQRRSRAPRPSRKPPRGRNSVRSAAARRQGRQAPATTRGELLDRLARLGLAQPCGPSALVLVGHDAELACLVFRWMEGARADEMLDRGAGSLAAEWVRNGALSKQTICALRGEGDGSRSHWLDRRHRGSPAGAGAARGPVGRAPRSIPAPGAGLRRLHMSFSVSRVVDLGDGPGVRDWPRVVPCRQAREERKARAQAPEAGPARPGWQVARPCCAGLT